MSRRAALWLTAWIVFVLCALLAWVWHDNRFYRARAQAKIGGEQWTASTH